MVEKKVHHRDCRNYAPVDVMKGICHRSKELIMGDQEGCKEWEMLPKCKCCRHFDPGEKPFIGACRADDRGFIAYPDMVAIQCCWFQKNP